MHVTEVHVPGAVEEEWKMTAQAQLDIAKKEGRADCIGPFEEGRRGGGG